ncbi:MAG: hypothetical protein ACJ795_00245 [Ktedonobacteraceae bacterium]
MKRIRLIALALFVLLMSIALVLPISAAAAPAHTSTANTTSTVTNRFNGIPVSGTASNGGTFKGRLNVTSFANQNGSLVANGTLNGTLRNSAGKVIGTVTNQAVTLPVLITQSTCTILTLTLGPLDLNLLGLMVHLNQVVLNITANPAGGLLGQLLCDIANLNLNGLLSQIVADLNQIIALLGV